MTVPRWLALPLAVIALAGCTRSEAGAPVPANDGAQPSDATDSFEYPRDLAAVADDPCALLTPQQLETIGPDLETSTSDTPWGQTRCSWENDQFTFSIAPDTRTGQTIEDTLSKEGFTPTTIPGGYPAARGIAHQDKDCDITVNVKPTEALLIIYQRRLSTKPEHLRPCEFIGSIAGMAIENIPPAS